MSPEILTPDEVALADEKLRWADAQGFLYRLVESHRALQARVGELEAALVRAAEQDYCTLCGVLLKQADEVDCD